MVNILFSITQDYDGSRLLCVSSIIAETICFSIFFSLSVAIIKMRLV